MAKTTGALKHVHKYFRRYDGMWACASKDGCTHYMPKNMDPLPAGMPSDCHDCGKVFQLAPYNMISDKPICDDCADKQEGIAKYLEAHGMGDNEPTNILERISKKAKEKDMARMKAQVVQEDEIEVIEADEQHAADCAVYSGEDCDCK